MEKTNSFSINESIKGKEYTIDRIEMENEVARHLRAMGFTNGAKIEVLDFASGGVFIKINNTRLALDGEISKHIFVVGERREDKKQEIPENKKDYDFFYLAQKEEDGSIKCKKEAYPKDITPNDKDIVVKCSNIFNLFVLAGVGSLIRAKVAKARLKKVLSKYIKECDEEQTFLK